MTHDCFQLFEKTKGTEKEGKQCHPFWKVRDFFFHQRVVFYETQCSVVSFIAP